ncbi:MAG: hypothetical protein GF307_09855 [candidate division Zixibacteria bacterium]|nr:hypothetical protein [candidate division Zixibacteria bacterium]
MELENEKERKMGDGILHPGARPMKVFLDNEGCMWLCDKDIDPDKGFENQGCWRCKDVTFTRND